MDSSGAAAPEVRSGPASSAGLSSAEKPDDVELHEPHENVDDEDVEDVADVGFPKVKTEPAESINGKSNASE